jgi:hypothetical protein
MVLLFLQFRFALKPFEIPPIIAVAGQPLKLPAARHRRSPVKKAGRRRFVLYAALRERRL